MSGAGYVGMGFSLKAFTHPQVERAVRETVCYKDAPQCVEVYAPMGDVIIQGDENAEEPEITAASSVYEVTMQFGALVVQPNEEYRSGSWTNWDWYRLLNLQPWGDYDVTITLPKRMMDSVKATSQLGDVSLSNLWVENVSAQASCGSVSASQLTQTDTFKVSASLGDVTVQGCSGKYLDLDSDLGNVQVDDCLFDNGDLSGSSGDIEMADSTWTWLTVQNDMGNCVLKGVTAQTSVTCGTSLGNVELVKLYLPGDPSERRHRQCDRLHRRKTGGLPDLPGSGHGGIQFGRPAEWRVPLGGGCLPGGYPIGIHKRVRPPAL